VGCFLDSPARSFALSVLRNVVLDAMQSRASLGRDDRLGNASGGRFVAPTPWSELVTLTRMTCYAPRLCGTAQLHTCVACHCSGLWVTVTRGHQVRGFFSPFTSHQHVLPMPSIIHQHTIMWLVTGLCCTGRILSVCPLLTP
jgi:hypothetical protein